MTNCVQDKTAELQPGTLPLLQKTIDPTSMATPNASTMSSEQQTTSQLPPKPPSTYSASNTTYSASDIRSEPSYWTSVSAKNAYDDEIGYTSPWTGATLTRKQLKEYASGKEEIQPDGSMVTVYFKPDFVEEGLWDRWEKKEK